MSNSTLEGGQASTVAVPTERDVPVHMMRDSLFDPSTWGESMEGDIGATMRRMQKQMVEMERQMERMFEQFHRLEPISSSRGASRMGRFPGWWDDESLESPFMGFRRGPRGGFWDSDLALPAPAHASPSSPVGEPPRMLRQTSRGAQEDGPLARQSSREPTDLAPYHAPYEVTPAAGSRVGQFGAPIVVDHAGNRKLRMRFDVRQFKPEEITVKTQDNKVSVRAVHKEESDSNQVYREYQRMFSMPPEVKPETLESALSPDGVLTLEAPMPSAIEEIKDTVIPIIHEK